MSRHRRCCEVRSDDGEEESIQSENEGYDRRNLVGKEEYRLSITVYLYNSNVLNNEATQTTFLRKKNYAHQLVKWLKSDNDSIRNEISFLSFLRPLNIVKRKFNFSSIESIDKEHVQRNGSFLITLARTHEWTNGAKWEVVNTFQNIKFILRKKKKLISALSFIRTLVCRVKFIYE